MRFLFTTLSAILLFCNSPLLGQILPMHSYTMENGLVSDDINAMCQDSSGYIWIATGEGLSVFDSREFRNYTIEDGLPTDNLSCITTDEVHPERIWIGTIGKGVVEYRDGHFIRFGQNLPPLQRSILCLITDGTGTVWCGTGSSVLAIRDGKVVTFSDSLGIGIVTSLAADDSGNILIGANNGLFEYVRARHTFIRRNLNIPEGQTIVAVMHAGHDSTLVLTYQGELILYENGTEHRTALARIGEFSNIFRAAEPGYFWVASDHGLFRVDVHHLGDTIHYTRKNGLPGDNVLTVFTDREGVLWVGTNGKGMAKLVHSDLLKFNVPESRKNVYNVSTVIDRHNHIWVSTSDRLLELWKDANARWHFYTQLKLAPDTRTSIERMCLSGGESLVLTFSAGTIREYDIRNQRPLSARPSSLRVEATTVLSKKFKFYDLYTSMVDNSGYLWTSAIDFGVIVLSNTNPRKVVKVYTENDGLPGNSIRCIYQDKRGNYWFGGYDQGLVRFSKDKVLKDLGLMYDSDNVRIEKFTTANGLPDNSVRTIVEDDSGDILIGTRYGGLAIEKEGRFRTISRHEGLLSNGVWDIAYAGRFGTWLATQSGMQKLNPDLSISNELANDIPKIQFYSISHREGEFVFANPTLLFFYQPSKSHLREVKPPIFVKRILVNGRPVQSDGNLDLPDDQNNITFDFVAVSNVKVRHRAFEYRLLGENNGWTRIVGRSSVTFGSLRPGRYKFQVVALGEGNLRSPAPAEVAFKIDAPFYSEWWFQVAAFLVVLSAVAAGIKYRVGRLLEIERVRTRIAAELHDEIGSGLTKIAILSEHALYRKTRSTGEEKQSTVPAPHEKAVERVGMIARGLVDQMADVIWSIDPKYDRLGDFIIHFKNHAYEVCEASNVELVIDTEHIRNIRLNSETKRRLHLVSVEALNNALKHSGCTRIGYRLSVEERSINLVFTDNGKGMSDGVFGKGSGLVNMRRHVSELGGIITFSSHEGKGTEIRIRIPYRS